MREVLRSAQDVWPVNMDLLFVLKPEVLTAEFTDLQASTRRTFEKIPEAMKLPPKPRVMKARRKTSVVYKPEK
jgi:hypothetical protein